LLACNQIFPVKLGEDQYEVVWEMWVWEKTLGFAIKGHKVGTELNCWVQGSDYHHERIENGEGSWFTP
jgi:hypothetical protein